MSSPSEVPPFRLPPGGVPILRGRNRPVDLAPPAKAEPTKGVSADALHIAQELRSGFIAMFAQLRDLNGAVATMAEPAQLAHIPCLAPLVTPEGDLAGWGVFCYACSFGEGENEFRYCQLEEVDLSHWPPQRVVAAPEFVEHPPEGVSDE